MTYQADEQRRSWKNCACPIYASGTLGKVFKRRNTERTTWDEANALARAWEAANSWDGAASAPASPTPAPTKERDIPADPSRVTIARAVHVFTAEFAEHAALNTQKKYGLLFTKLRAFSEDRGYVMLEQWDPLTCVSFGHPGQSSPRLPQRTCPR